MRDAQKVVRDLESVMIDSERALVGLPPRASSEPVTLADGAADQSLIPGVAPVPLTARQLAAERQRRDTRHGHAPLPCGGLWDETAQRQRSLF